MRSSQENVTDTISPYGRSTGDTQFTPAMPQFSAPKAPTASRSLQNDSEYVLYICVLYMCVMCFIYIYMCVMCDVYVYFICLSTCVYMDI